MSPVHPEKAGRAGYRAREEVGKAEGYALSWPAEEKIPADFPKIRLSSNHSVQADTTSLFFFFTTEMRRPDKNIVTLEHQGLHKIDFPSLPMGRVKTRSDVCTRVFVLLHVPS